MAGGRRLVAVMVLCAAFAPRGASAQVGGPDAAGNVFGPLSYDFLPLDGSSGPAGTILPVPTGGQVDAALPFPFPFYGVIYATVSVSANGALRFQAGAPTPALNDSIPSASVPSPDVAVYWDELEPSTAGAVYALHDAVNGRFVISWEGVARAGGVSPGTFQVQLSSDGGLRLYYDDLDFGTAGTSYGESATVGIQDSVGATLGAGNALQIGFNTGFLPSGSAFYIGPCVGDADGDGFVSDQCGGTDCDDFDAAASPLATEICGDAIDQDCSGADLPDDADGDGYSAPACGGTDCDDGDPALSPGVDADGDGSDSCSDCDDSEGAAFPGAAEVCDGLDGDCDGLADSVDLDVGADADGDGFVAGCGDCDDGDSFVFPGADEACDDGLDNDCDVATPDLFDADGDGSLCDVDCADSDANSFPGAPESLCSGVDEDCDPQTGDVGDGDGDGVDCTQDCDDGDALTYPGAPEFVCDGQDQACDGLANEEDADGDGVAICAGDCDDADAQVHPGAPELCSDGVDQDCDGSIDEALGGLYPLGDDGALTFPICSFSFPFCGDSFSAFTLHANGRVTFGGPALDGSDAAAGSTGSISDLLGEAPQIAFLWSDLDPTISGAISVEEDASAGAVTITLSNVTQSPTWPGALLGPNDVALTLDSDGFATLEYGAVSGGVALVGWACGGGATPVDFSAAPMPTAALGVGQGTESGLYEQFLGAAVGDVDVDLANSVLPLCLTAGDDVDGDGWTGVCGDCDDGDASTYPGAAEQCDGVDHNCSGGVNDVDDDEDGFAPLACGGGDCDDGRLDVYPNATEQCDGVDNDCDGQPEVGSEDADLDGWMVCAGDCDDGEAGTNPDAEELCNGADDDCDVAIDEGFVRDADADGVVTVDCGGLDCDDADSDVFPDAPEVCDGKDNDCGGVSDDVDLDLDGFVDAACGGDDCNDLRANTFPGAPQLCDGTDGDCNGVENDVDEDGDGEIDVECGGLDCDDTDAGVNTTAAETCDDGVDNDCDTGVDQGDGDVPGDPDCAGCACSALPAARSGWAVLPLIPLLALRRRRAA